MPSTILSSALSAPSLAVTSDLTSINIAQALSVSRVSIKLRSRIFRHKREDGTTIVDARVTEPKIVELDVFAPTLDAIAMLNSALLDREGTYTIKSRGLVFRRMMADQESIKQTADMLSASPVHVVFKELLTQNQTNVGQTSVAQPADSTMIEKGIQEVTSAVQTVQQLAATIQSQVIGAVAQLPNELGL
jgi:hypothetical protein